MNARHLPVASRQQVRRYARVLLTRHPRALAGVLALHAAAAVSGLAAPRLLGALVDGDGAADTIAVALVAFVVAQGVLVRYAYLAAARLGERVLAELREEFVDRVVELPLSRIERAGTGDLVSRSTRDVEQMSEGVREAVPDTVIGVVTILATVVALMLNGPLLAAACLVALPPLYLVTRWYLRRARDGYLAENAAWTQITDGFAETVDGARTVEAYGLADRRHARGRDDIAASWTAERYTMRLRTVLFPTMVLAFVLPVAATLLAGGLLHARGLVTLGQLTTAVLYVQQLTGPVETLLYRLDEFQLAGSSLARLLGAGEVPPDRVASGERPRGTEIELRDVRFAYRPGQEVLRGVDLTLRRGERLAIVGPSGAGKSTLARILAGVDAPTSGSATAGGVPLTALPLDDLRRTVALVTQEQHVFGGTVADNLRMVGESLPDARLRAALTAVAWDGPALDVRVGTGGAALTPAQTQQLALARLILADPPTLVLDEATSLLDQRAARTLERSLAAVLEGRTVIAIAHRLTTAHDADRVAVVEDGRITELGPHETLLAANGPYAALWTSWHGPTPTLATTSEDDH
ncbi:ABC transporter ATP-binding protein [Actinomadura flavalba]|uniref:ABC transporter ATP-binding protein n=1 Tax=Actinomadura flavalba TaxID=1120938 RepID=UPI00039C7E6B|nr:ABC transporter ATP-binding protein [Actinomadura flavalba]